MEWSPDICIEAQRSYDECTKTRFTVDLSGARSRHAKSEFLSINWVGRWGQNGQPQSGTYEAKCCAIDLSRLGVTSTRYFKITTAVSGGGEASADLKILAVDTSPGPAAQTMTFD